MPADLREGLYLTGIGMVVVFLALSGLLLIMVALQRLFPGKDTSSSGQDEGTPGQKPQAGEKPTPAELPQPLQAASSQSYGGVTGAQIAAIAAAAYLAMEQEGQLQPALRATPALSQQPSGWSAQGRTLLAEGQSRRPPPYQQKPHSAYSPKVGLS
ncbi:MAG: hypothetical protein HW388_163 [Dehalococcoidia bacterium]|nr:hypothetical protein [Dehalococcoidia bacterium]